MLDHAIIYFPCWKVALLLQTYHRKRRAPYPKKRAKIWYTHPWSVKCPWKWHRFQHGKYEDVLRSYLFDVGNENHFLCKILLQAITNLCLESIFYLGIGYRAWLSSFCQKLVSYFCIFVLRVNNLHSGLSSNLLGSWGESKPRHLHYIISLGKARYVKTNFNDSSPP